MEKQDLAKLQTRKMKGLKRKGAKVPAAAPAAAAVEVEDQAGSNPKSARVE